MLPQVYTFTQCVNLYCFIETLGLLLPHQFELLKGNLLPNTVEKIIAAASECFFQHGYSAANVSLICRYAGISRATIYKSFSSKETLFRALLEHHLTEEQVLLADYQNSKKDFWTDTEQLIVDRCQGIFDDIPNATIRSELIHNAQKICKDIITVDRQLLREAIAKRLRTELEHSRLSMSVTGLTVEDFARLVEIVPIGIVSSAEEDEARASIKHLFIVFRASTMA